MNRNTTRRGTTRQDAGPLPDRSKESSDDVHAMVLTGSGFGSSSCYALGVMKGLVQQGGRHLGNAPIDPKIYTGTVFSAFNATVMAAGAGGDAAATADHLERLWIEDITGPRDLPSRLGWPRRNGVFRLRMDPRSFFDRKNLLGSPWRPFLDFLGDSAFLSTSFARRLWHLLRSEGTLLDRLTRLPDATTFFDLTPLRELVEAQIDLDRLRRSSKELRIVASDWETGAPTVYHQKELTHEQIMATLAIFALFPRLELDGRSIAGGGIASPTPVAPAIEAAKELGAERLVLHIAFLSPRLPEIPFPEMPSTFDTFNRLTYFQMKGLEHRDIEQTLEPSEVRESGPAITVHCYRPRQPLWNFPEVLDYSREKAIRLITEGAADATAHDCTAQGCILAG